MDQAPKHWYPMRFTFDPTKAASNLAKHGVSFEEAMEVFEYDYLEDEDTRYAYNERRFRVLGWSGSRALVLMVVYTPRDGMTRLISARPANRKERSIYHAAYGRGL